MFRNVVLFFLSIFLFKCLALAQNFSISLSNQTDTICENELLSFTVNIQNCPFVNGIIWELNGAVVNSSNSIIFDTTGFQQGDVLQVQVSCQVGLDSAVTLTSSSIGIAVNSFILDAGPNLYIDSGTTIQFQSSSTADSLVWSPSFLVSNTSIIQPTTSPNETTTYQLKGIKSTCEKIDYVTVFVKGSFKIPNTFSPNGDGKNDAWLIQNIADFPANDMLIMNRFGQELYQSRPYTFANAWTGVFNGQPLPEGVYFYILNLGGDLGVKKGAISIIR